MIKFFCDKCGQEMPQPSIDQTCAYHGYNFPEDNVMIHLAYQSMNIPPNPAHWCPTCLIKLIAKRLRMNAVPPMQPQRIISHE